MIEKIFSKTIGVGLASFCLVLTLVIGIAQAADTIKIGFVDPLTGPNEYVGRAYLAGTQFAAEEQNAKGGLFGRKIEVLAEDSEGKPDVTVRKLKKLILNDKADFITIGSGSNCVIAATQVATEFKTPLIIYGGLSDEIMGKNFSPYAFRLCTANHQHMTALAKLMAKKPYRKFFMLAQDYAYGHDANRVFKEVIKKYVPDAQIVGDDYHPMNNKDFAPYINKIIASKADCVFTPNWGADGTNVIKQARAMGLKTPFPFVTPLAGYDPYINFNLGADSVGLICAQNYSLRVNTPENADLKKRWHEKYKKDKDFLYWWPWVYCAQPVLAWQMTFAAIEKAGTINADKVVETLEGFSYKSTMGLWQARKCDHQVVAPVYGGMVTAEPNPFYNGSIRPDVNFPYLGTEVFVFPAEEVVIPATPDYNPRCK